MADAGGCAPYLDRRDLLKLSGVAGAGLLREEQTGSYEAAEPALSDFSPEAAKRAPATPS